MSNHEDTPIEYTAEVVRDAEDAAESFVDALFDAGTAWAEHGIGYGKLALESSAKVLERTAKALEQLQGRLAAKSDERTHKAT